MQSTEEVFISYFLYIISIYASGLHAPAFRITLQFLLILLIKFYWCVDVPICLCLVFELP